MALAFLLTSSSLETPIGGRSTASPPLDFYTDFQVSLTKKTLTLRLGRKLSSSCYSLVSARRIRRESWAESKGSGVRGVAVEVLVEEAHIPLLPQPTHQQLGHKHLPQHFVSGAPASPAWGVECGRPQPGWGKEEVTGNLKTDSLLVAHLVLSIFPEGKLSSRKQPLSLASSVLNSFLTA